jgi:hypothetical protein
MIQFTAETTAIKINPWNKNGKINAVTSQHTQDDCLHNQGILRTDVP